MRVLVIYCCVSAVCGVETITVGLNEGADLTEIQTAVRGDL